MTALLHPFATLGARWRGRRTKRLRRDHLATLFVAPSVAARTTDRPHPGRHHPGAHPRAARGGGDHRDRPRRRRVRVAGQPPGVPAASRRHPPRLPRRRRRPRRDRGGVAWRHPRRRAVAHERRCRRRRAASRDHRLVGTVARVPRRLARRAGSAPAPSPAPTSPCSPPSPGSPSASPVSPRAVRAPASPSPGCSSSRPVLAAWSAYLAGPRRHLLAGGPGAGRARVGDCRRRCVRASRRAG